MPQVSRPLIALLIATVVFFAVWMVALKPKTTGGSSGGSAPLQSAIDKAHQAVTQSDAASVAHGGTVVSTPAATSSAATPSASATSHPASTATIAAHPSTVAGTAPTTQSATAAKQAAATKHAAKHATTTKTTTVIVKPAHASPVRTAAQRQAVVLRALHQHKVIALLFYNFRAADDRAVKKELAAVSTHGGKVVKLAVPLAELAQYGVVTRQVPVTASPTLILIDAQHKAWTVVGFASEFEISQRVDDALRVKAP